MDVDEESLAWRLGGFELALHLASDHRGARLAQHEA